MPALSGAPEPLRVALLGYGLAGSTFHAPFVAATPGLRLAAIVTRDPGRRAAADAAHPGARLLDTADAVWAAPDAFDCVVVATPNRTHVPLARAAIDAGLAVVVDKPLAPTAAEARALADHARARGVLLTVYQNRRWDGDLRTLRTLLADGALGDVLRLESRFERWRPTPRGGWRERAAPEEGGGILLDLQSHLVDQALHLLGPATRVYAELDRRRGVPTDDDTFVALTHASGARSHLWAGLLVAQGGPRFRALGTRAAWTKHGMDVQEAALRDGAAPGGDGWGAEPESAWGALGTDEAATRVPTRPGDWGAFWRALERALRGEGPPPVDVAEVVAALAVLDAARASAAEGRVVSLD